MIAGEEIAPDVFQLIEETAAGVGVIARCGSSKVTSTEASSRGTIVALAFSTRERILTETHNGSTNFASRCSFF